MQSEEQNQHDVEKAMKPVKKTKPTPKRHVRVLEGAKAKATKATKAKQAKKDDPKAKDILKEPAKFLPIGIEVQPLGDGQEGVGIKSIFDDADGNIHSVTTEIVEPELIERLSRDIAGYIPAKKGNSLRDLIDGIVRKNREREQRNEGHCVDECDSTPHSYEAPSLPPPPFAQPRGNVTMQVDTLLMLLDMVREALDPKIQFSNSAANPLQAAFDARGKLLGDMLETMTEVLADNARR